MKSLFCGEETAGGKGGMNDTPQLPAPSMPSSGRLIVTLGGIAAMSGLLVVLVFQLTAPRIAHNKRVALEHAVFTCCRGPPRARTSR